MSLAAMTTLVRSLVAALSLVFAAFPSTVTPRADAQTRPPQFQPKHEAADGTVLADREIQDCTIKQSPVKSGPPPPPELAKLLIRCLSERPSIPGGDGAITVDIDQLDVGAPRPWNPNQDVGSGHRATLVYPVHVVWTHKTFHRTQTLVQAHEGTFPCYVNVLGTWTCEPDQRIKDGEARRVPVK
jgi:hypothetical protein